MKHASAPIHVNLKPAASAGARVAKKAKPPSPPLALIPEDQVALLVTADHALENPYFYFIGCGAESGERLILCDMIVHDTASLDKVVALINQLAALAKTRCDTRHRIALLSTLMRLVDPADDCFQLDDGDYYELLAARYGSDLGLWEYVRLADDAGGFVVTELVAGFVTYYAGDM